ncbi:hypothetical protein HBI51_209830 [Parastagonospora nodorum]|nr:hypothetical protein HBI74_216840 [Parastagonospora nodorum]KAH5628805.1 hypothetical protein HBI51_209830 [Parastagonospora nodorum]
MCLYLPIGARCPLADVDVHKGNRHIQNLAMSSLCETTMLCFIPAVLVQSHVSS